LVGRRGGHDVRAGRRAYQPREIQLGQRRVIARLNQADVLPAALRLRRQYVVRRQHAGVHARFHVTDVRVRARQ
jgi:hypothetical protein